MNVRLIEEGKLNTTITPKIAHSHLLCSHVISEERSVLSQHFFNRPKIISRLKQEVDSDHIPAGLKRHPFVGHSVSKRCSHQAKVPPRCY